MKLVTNNRIHPKIAHLVSAFVTTDSLRCAMEYVRIGKNDLSATNGRSAVMVTSDEPLEIETGLYLMTSSGGLSRPLENPENFPDIASAIPDHTLSQEILPAKCIWQDNVQWLFARLGLPVSMTRFAKTFAAMDGLCATWTLHYGKADRPVVFSTDLGGATVRVVLMPYDPS